MTRKKIHHSKHLSLPISKKNRYEIAFSVESSTQNQQILNELEQCPEIREKLINLIVSNDEHGKDLIEMMEKYPNFDWIRFLYYINAIMKNSGAKHKKFRHIIDRRRATLFFICTNIGRQRHDYCYATTKKLLKTLRDIGFDVGRTTLFQDLKYLDQILLTFRNTRSNPQEYGGGSIRHIVTPLTAKRYESAWINKLNRFGTAKPQYVKDRFQAYMSKLLFRTPQRDKKNIPPIYMNKFYINYPPRGKTAQNREKRKTINPTEPAPEVKIASRKQRSCIIHTPPMSDWNPDWVNDPNWVTKEAVHQGCDEGLVKKLVHAVQLKEIPLKTNLLRAILHVAKSKDQGYIDAVARITAGERILSGGQGVVLPQSSGIFMPKIDLSRLDSSIESNSVELDPNTLSTIECTLRSAGHYPVTGSY